MLRLRRYRVFLIFAIIVIALLYHVSKNSQWEKSQALEYDTHRPPVQNPTKPDAAPGHHAHEPPKKPAPAQQPPVQKQPPKPAATTRTRPVPGVPPAAPPPHKDEPTIKIPKLKSTNEGKGKGAYGLPTAIPNAAPGKAKGAEPTTTTAAAIPNNKPGSGHHDDEGEIRYADLGRPTESTSTAIHWTKPYEYFPVPEESLIMLPTGKPKPIPRVQYNFGQEPPAAKEKREHRLAKIKAEAKRAWSGYKRYAWTHDEVRPVSKGPHDPFCGWAATLVDALDTLWITGLKEEFDDAVKAVKEIDFSTTPYRNDIPVFETIIRYLGGLVGAYDVTGGHKGDYRVLLDKAEELATILMSVFDTPNRMPVLYYQWKPSYNLSPKKASPSSGVAELGTMSMEFTRLAQLTGKNKYYDAIARITDALEDLQNRPGGTAIPGIFPQNLDASGCNRTAAEERRKLAASEAARKQAEEAERQKELEEEPQGYRPGGYQGDDEVDGKKGDFGFGAQDGDHPGSQATNEAHGIAKRDLDEYTPVPYTAQGHPDNPDCVPQGLVSSGFGMDSYSMGGSQDSAYEYFPKQYLLLGGLVPKYRTMHEKTVEAVKKYLLFRPQAQGDPDVLFSAKAFSQDGTDENLTFEYEVTHLTCFLGGMFGLGGKIFDSPEDVEIGKRLSAGCAWAYEVMPTGIMPEYAQILPCKDAADCRWNSTEWEQKVDPDMVNRQRQMRDYEERMKEWRLDVERAKRKAEEQEREEKRKEGEKKRLKDEEARRRVMEEEEQRRRPLNGTEGYGETSKFKHGATTQGQTHGHDLKEKSEVPDGSKFEKRGETEGVAARDPGSNLDFNVDQRQSHQVGEKQYTPAGGNGASSETRRQDYDEPGQKPIVEIHIPPEPVKPMTHEEYMEQQRLIPGFTVITDRRYILRPEAIESVWYMYRITGDPIWQDRGWNMWEAVVRATRTEVGHSAISDVTTNKSGDGSDLGLTDSMESFWLAETLKYFYLLFAEPHVISLDEWVLNTEAHPFRRPS